MRNTTLPDRPDRPEIHRLRRIADDAYSTVTALGEQFLSPHGNPPVSAGNDNPPVDDPSASPGERLAAACGG
jgi:hypothetical protein